MADPRRLLDDPAGLSELERRVLTAGGAAAPGQRVTSEIWTALSAKLPPPGGGPTGGEGPAGVGGATAGGAGAGAASTAGAKGVALLSIAKAGSIGLSLGVIAMAGVGVLRPRDVPTALLPAAAAISAVPAAGAPQPRSAFAQSLAEPGIQPPPRARAVIAERAPAPPAQAVLNPPPIPPGTALAAFPVAAPENDPNQPQHVAAPTPVPNPAPAPPVASVAPTHEESRLIAAARDALRGGSPARALSLLDQAQHAFPGGTLAQEREALRIEALAASGQRGQARELARRFLNAHPSSFHAARVRAFADGR